MEKDKEVIIKDVNISFENMVTLIIKFFFASIVAGIFIGVIIGVIWFALTMMEIKLF